ncbi:MAG TPA: hypothetical protein H9867_09495 [Candidatus Corynebacterium gallistercoris]|uniref:Sap, sulfolipid-1-addressing protein n=1 Tax=Candidatus Corynebacterium gallistercoris TaxID=2838530 RepID=A0A9D1RZM4_9CORY|nr:hypothetical protein [Candidatus Corynebacterium gallistercoris]
MLHAVSFALLDSINVLLIGVLFAVAVMHPNPARYGRIATVLVAGDWAGVFVLSIPTLAVFNSIEHKVRAAVDSPIFGIILIVFGLVSAILTVRGGDPAPLIAKLTKPLQRPSPGTFFSGMALGAIQSITSLPFFMGLAYLVTTDLATPMRYLALFLYASLALSLPILSAILLGMVLRRPRSRMAMFIDSLRHKKDQLTKSAGYVVAAILILMGLPKIL